MDNLINDLRLALRRLIREPLFAIIAVLTLAIGIGANSAIFTLVNGVLLRPLPFAQPDELVHIHAVIDGEETSVFSSPAFTTLRDEGRVFADVATFGTTTGTFTGQLEPERIAGGATSANYFDLVGVRPLHGRLFRKDENETGSNMVVLLSEALWRERFDADPAVIGRTVTINDRAREIVGVMPASASFPPEWRYWVPLEYTSSFNDPNNLYAIYLRIIARVKPGVTIAQAQADAARVLEIAKLRAAWQHPNWGVGVQPLHSYYFSDAREPLFVLLGAVGFVLLIACTNLANLLLAQAAARNTDFAVRRALGASAGRLMRQLTVESLVLGMVGGAVGLLFGAWGADALVAMMPPEMPRVPGLGVDRYVVAFTFVISLIAALLFGMAPALQARRVALGATLREGGRGVAGRSGTRTRAALVVAETALAFALVIGAGLLIRSFEQLRRVDPGFRAENTLTFDLLLPSTRYDNDERVAAFWVALTDRLNNVAGVRATGAISDLPLGGGATTITFDVEGRPERKPGEMQTMDVRLVTPGFFTALGVPLERGRLFTEQDMANTPRVALLSEAAVAKYFPGEDPIGKRIRMGWTRTEEDTVQGEVVGVVGNVRHGELRGVAQPEIYFAASQVPDRNMAVAVSMTTSTAAMQRAITEAVHELDPNLALAEMRPMREVVAASLASDRFMTRLLAAFSAMALILAAIGIFGVISYGVTQRRREIGVRMAVGASRIEIIRLVVGDALRLAGGGVLIGLVVALRLMELLRSMLFGIKPVDPVTFIGAALVLLFVATIASLLPAWMASRTSPASVLNTE